MDLAAYHDTEQGKEVYEWSETTIYNCLCHFEAMKFRWA